MVSVTTWNINSVRLRLPLVERFLTEQSPDVLCLQEIKCQEHQFPHEAFRRLGYHHIAINGQKGYHGVATVSRIPFRDFSKHDWQDNGEARHIGVELLGEGKGMIVENVYVPAGGDIPNRELNLKFGQKLDFLGRMTRWADAIDRPTLIVGDFNVAPLESDVWSRKQLLKVVSHTPIEVETLQRFMDAHGWVDIGREHIRAPDRYYSWWSYRAKDWKTGDRGRRLDHMWASPDLAKQATAHRVLEDARDWEKPSDHVPLTTEFSL
ncbi:exodeoxyribonuclease III [Erythrobacter sp. 3-20A1M]|uniref:exodeoxyribonuclease III n=1 Tax=Erythrobacter sp. 3-20A1M TaxID=2653850 RepID=UPI001BFC6E91|nr:exodeoxyribonuclease III [Erythrobacter sp. 3-20A1M]QWC56665.1 exodeoxyribonuclease III [Erythrobacter sp. 3-20A1M]